jgi:hypothetical protein
MPDDVTIVELVNRMAAIEARLKTNEDKQDRIEAMLHEVARNQSDMARNQSIAIQANDDRIEKIIIDRLEPIKETQRDNKTKLEGLEGGRRYNIVATASVCGTLFVIFAWFSNQNSDSTKQIIAATVSAAKSELHNDLNAVNSDLSSKVSQNANNISALGTAVSGYQEFKGIITSQNAGSLQDRIDQRGRIDRLETALTDLKREASAATQKFAEIETQFNADSQLRNVQFSDQQRTNAMIVDSISALGAKLPTYPRAPFYQPNISQQKSNGNNQ